MTWQMARRAERLNPPTLRETLEITGQPGIISLAGGLPSADSSPVAATQEATARVLRDNPREALQYAASEGFAPLRESVASARWRSQCRSSRTTPVVTCGSTPYRRCRPARGWARRPPTSAPSARCWRRACDWAAFWRPGCCTPKLLPAQQAADLHTPGFNQRVVHEVIEDGVLRDHVPTIRARCKAHSDAMRSALDAHMPAGCRSNVPSGGMFTSGSNCLPHWMPPRCCRRRWMPAWLACPAHRSLPATAMPTLRSSFVTVAPDRITASVAALAGVLANALACCRSRQGCRWNGSTWVAAASKP